METAGVGLAYPWKQRACILGLQQLLTLQRLYQRAMDYSLQPSPH